MSIYEVRQLPAPAGSASEPSVAFLGDSNTGIYSPGADQLAISTGGTGRLFVDASGNVSLNRSTPFSGNLTAYSAITGPRFAAVAFETTDSSSTNKVWRSISRFSGSAFGACLDIQAVADDLSSESTAVRIVRSGVSIDNIQLHTNGTERARIDSSGRLLVGTSTDTGGALLQVNDNRIRIATAKTPASATDTGSAGEICWDASYIYVCTATNTWKRTAIATW